MEWPAHIAHIGEIQMYKKFWSGSQKERDQPPRRHRRRQEDITRMNLRETGWEIVDWIHLTEDRDQWWSFVNK